MLNHLFEISGKVIDGKKRGKAFGYPTANINTSEKIPHGIYAAKVTVKDQEYIAAVFVGAAETFGESEVFVESYILDFDKNIYGQTIIVRLYKKLHDSRKYADTIALIKGIEQDVIETRLFFALK